MNRAPDIEQARGFLIRALDALQLYGPDAAGTAMVCAAAAMVLLGHDDDACRFAAKAARRATQGDMRRWQR